MNLYRHPGPVMTIGVNTSTAKACGTVFTIITPSAYPHPANSGRRTTTAARSGRNTKVPWPRYGPLKWSVTSPVIYLMLSSVSVLSKSPIVSVLQEALQNSERNRVAEQKKFTPVWKLRQAPPRDWHTPLNQENPQDSWTVTITLLSVFMDKLFVTCWRNSLNHHHELYSGETSCV